LGGVALIEQRRQWNIREVGIAVPGLAIGEGDLADSVTVMDVVAVRKPIAFRSTSWS